MDKIVITRPIVGICHMQVCVEKGVSDEEILDHCNRYNPSGTTGGWSEVLGADAIEIQRPAPCQDDPTREHRLVIC